MFMIMSILKNVFAHELQCLYGSETQLIHGMPAMAAVAHSAELRHAFETQIGQTETHVQRLHQVAAMCDTTLVEEPSALMEALLDEGCSWPGEPVPNEEHDACLIPVAQRIAMQGVAAYGTTLNLATWLQMRDAEALLQLTFNDERNICAEFRRVGEEVVYPAALHFMSNTVADALPVEQPVFDANDMVDDGVVERALEGRDSD